jgi:tetratricopeptide (TPR) repeat protein
LLWQKWIFFPFGLILPLAFIGIAAQWRRRRELILLYIFIIGYIPTVILFLVTARHRLPVIPFLLLFAAAGILALIEFIRKKNWSKLAAYALAVVIIIIAVNRTYFEIGFQNISQIHFNQGLTYERQGDLAKAEQEYIKALETNPLSPTILNNLGHVRYRLKKYDEAIENFRQAINSDRTFARAYNNAGLVFEARREYDVAERFYKQAIAVNPELYTTYINLSNLYLIQGDLEKAELGFKKAAEIAPDSAQAFFRLGSLYGRQKKFTEAIEMFNKGAQLGEPLPPDYVNWGNIYFGTKKPLEAINMFRRAIEQDENFVQAYFNLALTFHTFGYPSDSAEKYLNKVLSINPQHEPARRLLDEVIK